MPCCSCWHAPHNNHTTARRPPRPFASLGGDDPERTEPAWYLEKVPELKVAKNRMHLDLVDPDPSAVDRLVALGASVVELSVARRATYIKARRSGVPDRQPGPPFRRS